MFLTLMVAAASLGSGGCDSGIFDVDVNLKRQVYNADFGTAQGTIPVVACDPQGPAVCGASAGTVPIETNSATGNVQLACDGTTSRCYAQARVLWSDPVDVLQDDDFITKVERHSVVAVRQVDLAYTVPANTLTFDVPAIQIFVGPAGAAAETDPGVVSVGSTAPVAAGAIVDGSATRHLVVADGSPARSFIATSILNQQTMVFILVLAPRLEAGAPVPAGALEVDLAPRLTLGLPR
jgi:hypothetical protein